MSPLEQLRAAQHDDQRLTSDHQLEAFLAEIHPETVRLDRLPTTDIELLHLNRASAARRTA